MYWTRIEVSYPRFAVCFSQGPTRVPRLTLRESCSVRLFGRTITWCSHEFWRLPDPINYQCLVGTTWNSFNMEGKQVLRRQSWTESSRNNTPNQQLLCMDKLLWSITFSLQISCLIDLLLDFSQDLLTHGETWWLLQHWSDTDYKIYGI
jgi:hypothetical protein